MLAQREQQGCDNCANPNLLPCHRAIREYFEDHGKEHGGERKREDQVRDLQDRCEPGEQPIKVIAEHRQRGADHQRHQQEPDNEDDCEAQQPRFQAGAIDRPGSPAPSR